MLPAKHPKIPVAMRFDHWSSNIASEERPGYEVHRKYTPNLIPARTSLRREGRERVIFPEGSCVYKTHQDFGIPQR